jgi:beta-1,4-mannosyltransferase
LSALAQLEARVRAPIDVHVTGDGPLRPAIETHVRALPLSRVRVHFGYLPRSEYAALLQRADLGISLHRSSSGVDLAMKVVDMFEAHLPVCALGVGTSLPEQVQDGVTGVLFRSAEELSSNIAALLQDPARITRMREAIAERWQETWAAHWDRVAAPHLGLGSP